MLIVIAIIGIAGCASTEGIQQSQQVKFERVQNVYNKAEFVLERYGEKSSEGELIYEGELYIELFVGPDLVSSLNIDYKGHEVFGASRKPGVSEIEVRAYVPGKWERILAKLQHS
jgi:hypothetical protein